MMIDIMENFEINFEIEIIIISMHATHYGHYEPQSQKNSLSGHHVLLQSPEITSERQASNVSMPKVKVAKRFKE